MVTLGRPSASSDGATRGGSVRWWVAGSMNSTRASGAVVTSGGSLRGDARTGWHAWPTEGHCSELAASDRVNTPRPRGRGRRRGEARPFADPFADQPVTAHRDQAPPVRVAT